MIFLLFYHFTIILTPQRETERLPLGVCAWACPRGFGIATLPTYLSSPQKISTKHHSQSQTIILKDRHSTRTAERNTRVRAPPQLSHADEGSALWDPRLHVARRAALPVGLFRRDTAVDCRFLLRGSPPTQGANSSLLHWQTDSLRLRHLGSSSNSQTALKTHAGFS